MNLHFWLGIATLGCYFWTGDDAFWLAGMLWLATSSVVWRLDALLKRAG